MWVVPVANHMIEPHNQGRPRQLPMTRRGDPLFVALNRVCPLAFRNYVVSRIGSTVKLAASITSWGYTVLQPKQSTEPCKGIDRNRQA